MPSKYEVRPTQELCRTHGVTPFEELLRLSKDSKGSLELNTQSRDLVRTIQADFDVFYLSSFLAKGCALRCLSISHQVLSSTALQYLSQGLQGNVSLKSLSLTFTMISACQGFTDLAEALRQSRSLEGIDLSHNK